MARVTSIGVVISMANPPLLNIDGAILELRVDDSLAPSVLRALGRNLSIDTDVDTLPIPDSPISLNVAIRMLRWYRSTISPHLAARCVFAPSCSRYAELAIRQYGVRRSIPRVVTRLARCRPGNGGQDLPG